LRVALLSESAEFGGAEHYLLLLARGIAGLGHEPVFLMPAAASWRARVSERGWRAEEYPRIARTAAPLRLAWLAAALRRVRPDVLHINLPSAYAASFTAGALIGRTRECPVVTTEHLSMVGRSRRRALLKGAFTRHVDRIIAVSEATKRALVERHGVDPSKIVVIPNGVDPADSRRVQRKQARERFGVDGGALVIGSVGELIPRKGHSYLIEALPAVRSRVGEDVRLVLVGGGIARPALERLAEEKGVLDAVVFAGRVRDAGALLSAFDVFAMPSLMEAMPFALIEAMAAGLPAVAASAWGIPEVVVEGETGFLVPPGDADALADALARLLEDRSLRGAMGAAAKARAEAVFSLEAMASKTVEVYGEVAGRGWR